MSEPLFCPYCGIDLWKPPVSFRICPKCHVCIDKVTNERFREQTGKEYLYGKRTFWMVLTGRYPDGWFDKGGPPPRYRLDGIEFMTLPPHRFENGKLVTPRGNWQG